MFELSLGNFNTFFELYNLILQNAPPSNPPNNLQGAQITIMAVALVVEGLLTYMIFSVNDELKEIEAEHHTPQFEVGRYRYYPRKEKDSFEVEISNFGQGSVRDLVGVAEALPDDSNKFDPIPIEIPLERREAVESNWNAVRANGVAPNEHNVGFICEAGLKFGSLNTEDDDTEEDTETETLHFQQAVADLTDQGVENIRFRYWLDFDNEYCDEEETRHEVIDLIFPAREEWDLKKAINDGWEYEEYVTDKQGYEMDVL